MKTVGDLLRGKPDSHLYCVGPDTSVLEAAELMAEKGIGAVLVLEDGQLAGIVTERDYVRRVVLLERSAYATSVAEIMTRELFVVGLSDSNQYCMQLMIKKNLRHLPVLEQGELVGLLSIRDLVRDVTSEQENLIEQLQQYIRGA